MGEVPFFNQLTFIGTEGSMPDMIDCTPSSTGFQFRLAPNGKNLQLIQMQQHLGSTDLASSFYDAATGGTMGGYLRHFKPLAADKVKAAPEIDVSFAGDNLKNGDTETNRDKKLEVNKDVEVETNCDGKTEKHD